MHALAGMKAHGVEVPAGLEAELSWESMHFACSPWRDYEAKRVAYRAALEALGRERTLALARQTIDRGYNRFQALSFLAASWDEALCSGPPRQAGGPL